MNGRLDGGGKQVICPQCLGRFTSDAKTRTKLSAKAKRSARRNRITKAPGTVPHLTAPKGTEFCCSGFADADVCILGNSQTAPWGTPAQRKSYLRRLRAESGIGAFKLSDIFEKGWCRTFGLPANTIGATLAAVWRNIMLAREYRAKRHEQKQQRRQIKLSVAGGTQDGDAGATEAPTDAEPGNDSDEAVDPPARPPP